MKDLKEAHNEAMTYMQEALVAQYSGNDAKALDMFEKAFQAERSAALGLLERYDSEPARSILFRSAVALAMDCGKYTEALDLIRLGLSGTPPNEFVVEFKQMDEEAHKKLAEVPDVLASYLAHFDSEKLVLSEQEMDQLIQMMGKLSPSEMNVIRNEHSLVERLMNALAKYLLLKATIHQARGGDLSVAG